ncbi:Protein SCO1 2, mitochondrial [Turnera subulata]|uniref:Protein SCO1 2, mitochondrial n=1 Tax=Turnera subulata TaxID=218843 RepID=A0A9Q0JGA5_9ROSI|nr:Protein SCO1 2, mitochondrial [Turnera subulata]
MRRSRSLLGFSKSLFSSQHSPEPAALSRLQRLGPSRRIQCCSYSKSWRNWNGKSEGKAFLPMEIRPARSLIVPGALLGFAGLVAFVHYNDERRAIPKGNNSACVTVKGPVIGGPFSLINTENQVVTEKDFMGNWVLLYFGYTSSPDIGPEQLQVMAKAISTVESQSNLKVLPLFVTIDPQRDTPSHLRAYLKGQNRATEFDSRIVGLTGPVAAVRQMAQEYRVFFKKIEEEGEDYLVDSSHSMYLINPNMEVVRCFGVEYNAQELSEAILKDVRRTTS